jgi:hypothetical protein
MADQTQIISLLRKLSAYYGKEPSKEQARVYLELLADLEPAALEFAVQEWIKHSPFFPRINELLQTARRYQPQPLSPTQALRYCQGMLERKFWQQGIFNPQEWEALAARFEIHGCLHQAQSCRSRGEHYQTQIEIAKDPSKWKEINTQTRQKWPHQADQFQQSCHTGVEPEPAQ